MKLEMEMGEAVNESLRAALVLTGSMEESERAITKAITALGPDLSQHTLLRETARSAFQQSTLSDRSSSILPVELQALSFLRPTCRYCFVLRFLIGFDLETCSEILALSRREVEEALYCALLDLPRAVESAQHPGRVIDCNAVRYELPIFPSETLVGIGHRNTVKPIRERDSDGSSEKR